MRYDLGRTVAYRLVLGKKSRKYGREDMCCESRGWCFWESLLFIELFFWEDGQVCSILAHSLLYLLRGPTFLVRMAEKLAQEANHLVRGAFALLHCQEPQEASCDLCIEVFLDESLERVLRASFLLKAYELLDLPQVNHDLAVGCRRLL